MWWGALTGPFFPSQNQPQIQPQTTSRSIRLLFEWVKNFCGYMNSSAAQKPLAVSGRFFSRNSAAEFRALFFDLTSRLFLFPYLPTQFVLARWNSLLCLFDRGAAQLIQSCASPFVGFPLVIKNQPQKRRAKRAVATNFCGWFCDGKNGPLSGSFLSMQIFCNLCKKDLIGFHFVDIIILPK